MSKSEDKAGTEPGAKERILDAAEHLFARDGFESTPTSRIADLAGVPKGLIHYYFRRKVDLLEALVDRHAHDELDLDDLVVAGDPEASLCRLARACDAQVEGSPLLRHLLWREADTHDSIRAAGRAWVERLVGQIRILLVRSFPECAGSPNLDSAAMLAGMTLGYRHSVLRHGNPLGDADAQLRFIAAALRRGLGPVLA